MSRWEKLTCPARRREVVSRGRRKPDASERWHAGFWDDHAKGNVVGRCRGSLSEGCRCGDWNWRGIIRVTVIGEFGLCYDERVAIKSQTHPQAIAKGKAEGAHKQRKNGLFGQGSLLCSWRSYALKRPPPQLHPQLTACPLCSLRSSALDGNSARSGTRTSAPTAVAVGRRSKRTTLGQGTSSPTARPMAGC